ncbi:aminotransferase class IV [Paenibacillus aurantius]|uniref:Aminotransferase class IV n=1 Tax=Paenibacillus aurantius TaxID=2918900 RepID=A0AA96LGT0_9BACL|nr:aminotransferase class IV [Paenibacillus aurantius]WNQ11701.1 aminotransferase class IV [Paenibacillus aurantius]
MIISLNGELVPQEKALVSAYDHGFLYGMGLFETFRTYAGRPFLLERHLTRLAEGCRELGIEYVPSAERIGSLINRLLEANGLWDAYFRLTITAGEDLLGLPSGPYRNPTEIGYIKELPPVSKEIEETGKALQKLQLRRNSPEGEIRHKSLHYMNNIMAKREMVQYPWSVGAEGLFFTAEGFAAEGIVSNVFFIFGDILATPPLSTGLLPGITRALVMELARLTDRKVVEDCYTWNDILRADEIFLTNSIQEIVPVTRLYDTDGQDWIVGKGAAGPVTRQLMREYRRLTEGGRA